MAKLLVAVWLFLVPLLSTTSVAARSEDNHGHPFSQHVEKSGEKSAATKFLEDLLATVSPEPTMIIYPPNFDAQFLGLMDTRKTMTATLCNDSTFLANSMWQWEKQLSSKRILYLCESRDFLNLLNEEVKRKLSWITPSVSLSTTKIGFALKKRRLERKTWTWIVLPSDRFPSSQNWHGFLRKVSLLAVEQSRFTLIRCSSDDPDLKFLPLYSIKPTMTPRRTNVTMEFHQTGSYNALERKFNLDTISVAAVERADERPRVSTAQIHWEDFFFDLHNVYRDLSGRVLVVNVNLYYPWMGFDVKSDGRLVPTDGIDNRLLNTLGLYMNFSYVLTRPKDGTWGDIREDKVTYTGIVGELNERRADLSACEITVSYVRTTGADFSYPYYFDSCSFATLAPKELSRAFVVLQPFKVETWTAFAVSAAAIFGLVAVMDRITEKFILVFICSSDERPLGPETSNTTGARRDPFGRALSSTGRPTKFIPTFKEFLFASLSAAKNRAIDLVLEQFTPRRIALCFFFLTMVVISALYSGTLTAFMAFPGFSPTLNDLNDLLKACLKGDIVWGTLRGTSQLTLFRTATSGVYKDLYDVTLKAGLDKTMVGSPVQGVQTVLYGNYVYIHPTVTLMFYAAKLGGETTFHISRDSFYANFYGIGFQQGSPIKPKMDQMVFRILSSGVIYKWRKELIDEQLAEAPKDLRGDPKEIEDERRAFSLNDMQSAFYVLFIGYGLCFLAFGLEVFLHDSKWKETNE